MNATRTKKSSRKDKRMLIYEKYFLENFRIFFHNLAKRNLFPKIFSVFIVPGKICRISFCDLIASIKTN